MRFLKKRKTAYSLLEAVLSLVCIGILMAAVFTTVAFSNFATAKQKALVSMDSVVVCLTEAVSADLEQGMDVIAHDYTTDTRIKSDRITYKTVIDYAEDVYGVTLYQIEIIMADRATNTVKTEKVFVVGEEA